MIPDCVEDGRIALCDVTHTIDSFWIRSAYHYTCVVYESVTVAFDEVADIDAILTVIREGDDQIITEVRVMA